MSKITLDNLSDNLKAYLEGLGLSEEQVLNLINENGLDEEELKAMLKDTMSINELSTNSKTVIGAINELFQSANNGKELIANAIGKPLSKEDTFSAMSDKINNIKSDLKQVLTDEGVSVSNEDNMDSLITKVDEEFDRKNTEMENSGGLDIISATELPATGKENQICVITDNPVDKFFVTNFKSDIPEGYDGIALVLSTTATNNPIETVTGTQTLKLHFLITLQNNNSKTTYVFKNGSWQVLTKGVVLMITNTGLFNTDIFGYFDSRGGGVNVEWQDNYGYYFYCNGDYSGAYLKNNKLIDFSEYNKITFTISNPYNQTSYFGSKYHHLVLIDDGVSQIELISRYEFSANGTYTVDISNLYKKGYIQIYTGNHDNGSMSWFNVSYLAIE